VVLFSLGFTLSSLDAVGGDYLGESGKRLPCPALSLLTQPVLMEHLLFLTLLTVFIWPLFQVCMGPW
jgi:hypothetical protein